jgi:hypothetical protein
MTYREPSWLAAVLLRFVASEEDGLAGDLVEELRAGRSRAWFWRQVVRAAWMTLWAKRTPSQTVVRLTDSTPFDRPDRTFGLLDPALMQLSGRRLRGPGGAGLLGTILLITLVLPQAWFLLLFSLLGGIAIAVVLVRQGRDRGISGPPGRQPLALFDPHQTSSIVPASARRGRPMELLAGV